MNNENLRPLNTRSQRERKEIARKGAIASNKKKEEIKTMRNAAIAFLRGEIPMEELNGQTGAVASILAIAKRLIETGDPAAFNAIMTVSGEKPTDRVSIGVDEESVVKMEEFFSFIKGNDA